MPAEPRERGGSGARGLGGQLHRAARAGHCGHASQRTSAEFPKMIWCCWTFLRETLAFVNRLVSAAIPATFHEHIGEKHWHVAEFQRAERQKRESEEQITDILQ